MQVHTRGQPQASNGDCKAYHPKPDGAIQAGHVGHGADSLQGRKIDDLLGMTTMMAMGSYKEPARQHHRFEVETNQDKDPFRLRRSGWKHVGTLQSPNKPYTLVDGYRVPWRTLDMARRGERGINCTCSSEPSSFAVESKLYL